VGQGGPVSADAQAAETGPAVTLTINAISGCPGMDAGTDTRDGSGTGGTGGTTLPGTGGRAGTGGAIGSGGAAGRPGSGGVPGTGGIIGGAANFKVDFSPWLDSGSRSTRAHSGRLSADANWRL